MRTVLRVGLEAGAWKLTGLPNKPVTPPTRVRVVCPRSAILEGFCLISTCKEGAVLQRLLGLDTQKTAGE